MTKPTPTPTAQELIQGYSLCDCGGVHLHQAGYELELHCCSLCGQWVTNSDEFFRKNEAIDLLSK